MICPVCGEHGILDPPNGGEILLIESVVMVDFWAYANCCRECDRQLLKLLTACYWVADKRNPELTGGDY